MRLEIMFASMGMCLALIVCADSAFDGGREINIRGDFCKSTENLPDRSVWSFWSPVKNDPRISVIPGKGLRISGGDRDGGISLRCEKRVPAEAGDTVVLKFKASGKGRNLIIFFWRGMSASGAKLRDPIGSKSLPFTVNGTEQEFMLRADVTDTEKGKTTHVNFWISSLKDAELLVKEISFFIVKGKAVEKESSPADVKKKELP